jgi:hypothetical protein
VLGEALAVGALKSPHPSRLGDGPFRRREPMPLVHAGRHDVRTVACRRRSPALGTPCNKAPGAKADICLENKHLLSLSFGAGSTFISWHGPLPKLAILGRLKELDVM